MESTEIFKNVALMSLSALIIVCVIAVVWFGFKMAKIFSDLSTEIKQDACDHVKTRWVDDCPDGSIKCMECDKRLR